MRRTFYLLLSLFTIGLSISSCNDKVDLIGDFKETAIVYGLLDQSDSVHYIKITRAFIGPGNSYEIAQVADSNYFQSVDAKVEEYVNGTLQRTWTLKDTTINEKSENGIFYAPEQKLYVFYTSSLNPLLDGSNVEYRLTADINDGLFTVTGQTGIVSGISTSTDQFNYAFSFKKSTGEYKNPTVSVNVGNSYVVNTSLDVDFEEFIGASSSIKRMSWQLGEVEVTPGGTQNFTANGVTFYQKMASSCAGSDPAVDKRNLIGITVRVTGGSEDLYNYMLVNQPSSSIAQSKPTFTNLKASNDFNVIGVFASRYTYEVYHPFVSSIQSVRCLDYHSTKELCIGTYTGSYLFCSNHAFDIANGETWACN